MSSLFLLCYYLNMNISFKIYDKLPLEAKEIRIVVFVKEQGFIDEFDESDNDAIHIVMFLNDIAIGTSRIIFSKEHDSYMIGRFTIIKEQRNKGFGTKLIEFTESEIIHRFGHIQIAVSAQERAIDFYKKMGYILTNETYLDQNYPHTLMIKNS